MVIVYHGTVQSLREQIDEHKEALDKRYTKIFGEERAKIIAEAAKRLLDAKSYFNSTEEFNEEMKGMQTLPSKTSNKFGIGIDTLRSPLELTLEGRLIDRKIRTTPMFYISESGFNNSASAKFTDRSIASYIHEYNHFITYVLQRFPINLVEDMLLRKLETKIPKFDLTRYLKELAGKDISLNEKFEKLKTACQISPLIEMYESANRILDKSVLDSIGINVPLHWRGKPRQHIDVPFPPNKIFRIGAGGDMFKGLSDNEVIEKMMNWEEHFNQAGYKNPILTNLVDSLKDAKVSRISLTESNKQSNKKKRKKK